MGALRAALLTSLQAVDRAYGEWDQLTALAADLRWQNERKVFRITRTCNVMIWGAVTEPVGDGYVIRYGKEMPRTLEPGDRVAVYRERAVVLLSDSMRECPSIMDFDQDGRRLAAQLLANGCAVRM